MKFFYIIQLFVFICCFQCLSDTQSIIENDSNSALSKFIRHHELVFKTADRYRAVTVKQVNTDDPMLYEIVFSENSAEFDGVIRVPVPEDILGIVNDFDLLKVQGDFSSESVALQLESSGEVRNSKVIKQKGGKGVIIERRLASLHFPADVTNRCELVIRGSGTLKSVALKSKNGINRRVDLSDYKSFKNVEAHRVNMLVDASCRYTVGGVGKLDRQRFFNVHGAYPVSHPEIRDYILERNFTFGRMALHMPQGLKGLKEDSKRSGYADYSYFTNENAMAQGWLKNGLSAWRNDQAAVYDEMPWLMYFHGCPSFMAVKGIRNGITPKNYDAMGELLAEVLSVYKRSGSVSPKWIEVLNESDIPSEWGWHWDDDAMAKNANYHNTVATHIHERFPETKVGGPTSAWPWFDDKNFSTAWKRHRQFIDITQDTLDFYSLHFYEQAYTFPHEAQLKKGVRVFSQGRLDACLDLFENYQVLTCGKVKPLVVSECGRNISVGALGDLQLVCGLNTYLMRFMNRPDRIQKIIEFLIPYAHWDNSFPWVLFRSSEDFLSDCTGEQLGSYNKTYLTRFLDLWSDVQGERIKIVTGDPKVLAHAFVANDDLYIAVNNINGYPVLFSPEINFSDNSVEKAFVSRIYPDKGEMVFIQNQPVPNPLHDNRLEVEETAIFHIKLKKMNTFSKSENEKVFYGNKVIIPLRPNVTNTVSVQKVDLGKTPVSARLNISFAKSGGFAMNPVASFNGHPIQITLEDTAGINEYFERVYSVILPEWIKESNEVCMRFDDPSVMGAHIGSVTLNVVYPDQR